eukprot:3197109-Prymnesium_polylepis.1
MSWSNVPPKMSSTVLPWVPTWLGSSLLRSHTTLLRGPMLPDDSSTWAHAARFRHHVEEEVGA